MRKNRECFPGKREAAPKAEKIRSLRLAVSALALTAAAIAALAGCGQIASYTVNQETMPQEKLVAAEGFRLFSNAKSNIAFQYPEGGRVEWKDADGAYLYKEGSGNGEYVLISRKDNAGMTPEKYFKSCNQMMLSSFDEVSSTKIHEAPVEDKTLYMVRYLCQKNGQKVVADRYLELYPQCYIEYTAISGQECAMDTELYYAIATLHTTPAAYAEAYQDSLTARKHPDLNLSLSLPDMLDIKELTIGYFASSQDAVFLCVLLDKDDVGNPIYNRQDFIDRASRSSSFVAAQLGADSAIFGEGKEKKINGRSFYVYPMQMTNGDAEYEGELYLANAENTGCYVFCFAARNESVAKEDILELCRKSAESIQIN